MPSSFFGLTIGASGVSTYDALLNVTAHNISNTKTEGYARQSTVQKAKEAISLGASYGMVGAGSEAIDVVNTRDAYYDYKYRKSNAVLGYYENAVYYMDSIQDHLYSPDSESAGLSNSLNRFFDALTNLTTDPTNTTIRAQVTGYADTLATYANEMFYNLQQMQDDINSQISNTVDEINSYGMQIASLTKQISTLEVYGSRANDLRDQRAVILDKLAKLADIDVVELPPAEGKGIAQFIVNLGGGVLVDTNTYNTIHTVTAKTFDNQTDADGLYSLQWSNGQMFGIRNTKLGGKLQALFEIRDGNNGENFKSELQDTYSAGNKKLKMYVPASNVESGASLAKLNIPASDGIIDIQNFEFEYESFEVKIDIKGNYTYEFTLKDALTATDALNLNNLLGAGKVEASIGDAVEYRGIPYYMSQLNEFLRTFTATFNQAQNKGYDLNGDKGVDLFKAKDITSGEGLNMTEFLKNTRDGYYYLNGCKVLTSTEFATYTTDATKFDVSKQVRLNDENGVPTEYYELYDKDNNLVETVYRATDSTNIFSFKSTAAKGDTVSYYNMTAKYMLTNQDLVKDGKLLACAAKDPKTKTGIAEGQNLAVMAGLQSDEDMFKQGNPISFLQVMTATVGVDSKKVIAAEKNSQNIVDAVGNRRLATMGVDEDEEAQNLVEAQNLLNAQYKVISVMNEVLDKLINGMGL